MLREVQNRHCLIVQQDHFFDLGTREGVRRTGAWHLIFGASRSATPLAVLKGFTYATIRHIVSKFAGLISQAR